MDKKKDTRKVYGDMDADEFIEYMRKKHIKDKKIIKKDEEQCQLMDEPQEKS